jgi:hypothetical protein
VTDDEAQRSYDRFYHLHPQSYLCDIVCGVELMTRDIAAMVRFLRVEHKVGCEAVAYYLSERREDSGYAMNYQLGKALSELAAAFFHERIEDWPP